MTRLDQALVERGLFASRAKARSAVLDGLIEVDGSAARKPAQTVSDTSSIVLLGEPMPYVSRAAMKLVHALNHFRIDPAGRTALDIGASTGGFTQVLLERGAGHIYAVDVGHGQLDVEIAKDPRVTVLEKLNARSLSAKHIAEPPGIIVCDVSFISLKLALPPALALAQPGAQLIALIKPQFEVGRKGLGKGGIVRDPQRHRDVCDAIRTWLRDDIGWEITGLTPSPIEGSDGNREFLIAAQNPAA